MIAHYNQAHPEKLQALVDNAQQEFTAETING
jgi:hypothetical protein